MALGPPTRERDEREQVVDAVKELASQVGMERACRAFAFNPALYIAIARGVVGTLTFACRSRHQHAIESGRAIARQSGRHQNSQPPARLR